MKLEFLAGPDHNVSLMLNFGFCILFYKLAVHSLLGSFFLSNIKTFVHFEMEKITF